MVSTPTESAQLPPEQHTALAVAITSGKGGVGKTNLTTNLGIALAQQGHKVCIFDADTSLANINILLGLNPKHTLEHYLNGTMSIEEIMLNGPEGLQIVPSASGIAEYSNLSEVQQERIVTALQTLEQTFDYILIDTAAGISENVIRFLQCAQYAVVVISPEPTSLTDAFSLIKVLQRRHYDQPIYTLVNMANNYKHSMEVFKRFAHAVNKYVNIKVRYLGYIPMDQAMRNAVANQSPVIISEPQSPAARCISLLTQILIKHFKHEETPDRGISQFWRSQSKSSSDHPDSTEDPETEVSMTMTMTRNSTDVISSQQEKEASRILALTKDALSSQEFSRKQADELLASLIENYLLQFGSLPQQAIDLVAQAQDQLSPDLSDHLSARKSANDDSETTPESIRPGAPEQYTPLFQNTTASAAEETQVSLSALDSIQDQISNLVSDAERTKHQLTELTRYLNSQYRELYNADTDYSKPSRQPLRPVGSTDTSSADRAGLVQSIRYAAAVDKGND